MGSGCESNTTHVCECFHALSRSLRVHDFWIKFCLRQRKHKELFLKCFSLNKSNKDWQEEKSIYSFCVPLNKKSPNLIMSVFCSNSLIHAPECGKCILRDPNFQNFPRPPRNLRLTALTKDAFGIFQYLSAYFSNSAIYSICYWKPCLVHVYLLIIACLFWLVKPFVNPLMMKFSFQKTRTWSILSFTDTLKL